MRGRVPLSLPSNPPPTLQAISIKPPVVAAHRRHNSVFLQKTRPHEYNMGGPVGRRSCGDAGRRCTLQAISRLISSLQPPYYFLIWVSRFLLPGHISLAIGRWTGPYNCPHLPTPDCPYACYPSAYQENVWSNPLSRSLRRYRYVPSPFPPRIWVSFNEPRFNLTFTYSLIEFLLSDNNIRWIDKI